MTKKKLEPFRVENSTINLERIDFEEILNEINPIIFDTNFLFTTFEFNVDVISELKRLVGSKFSLYIYEGTIEELKNIEKKKEKNKKYLPLIIKMLKVYNFKIIRSKIAYIDEQILSNLNKKVLVATNDKELRELIHAQQFRILYLRQKSYLEIK